MKRYKILQLQSHVNISSSDLGEQIIKELPVDEYEITSSFLKGTLPQKSKSNAAVVKCFNFSSASLKGIRRWLAIIKLYRYCKKEKFDLIIAHRFKPIHMVMQVSRLLKIPAIGIIHGIGDFDRKYRRKIIKRFFSDQWTMVGVSSSVKDYLTNLECGLTEQNTVAINNAIDIDAAVEIQLSRSQALAALHLPDNKLIFGTIGRLVPVKGQIYLLEAFNKIKNDLPEAILVIIGEGREREKLEEYIERHNLNERVFLAGERNEAIQYLKAFDIFVLPSLSEGLPLALLEAMSAALPVMGSDINAIRPLIEEIGFVFRAKDPESLSQKMLEAARADREAIGKQTFARLRQFHDISDFRTSYKNLIQEKLISG